MILPYGHIRASNCESVETVGRNGWPYDEIRSLFVREYLHNLEPFIKRENSVSPPSPPANLSLKLFWRVPFLQTITVTYYIKSFFWKPYFENNLPSSLILSWDECWNLILLKRASHQNLHSLITDSLKASTQSQGENDNPTSKAILLETHYCGLSQIKRTPMRRSLDAAN